MNANKLRSRFEKPAAGAVLLAALGTVGVSGCSESLPSSGQKTIVCEGEQNVPTFFGDTMGKAIVNNVKNDVPKSDTQNFINGVQAHADEYGQTFTIRGTYDQQDVQLNAGTSVTLPKECTVVE